MGASKTLGIIGICLSWLFPIVGVVLGIIGLSIDKERGHEKRDEMLNTLAIILSVFFWIVFFIILIATF
jgi:uncharacterized membrane protein